MQFFLCSSVKPFYFLKLGFPVKSLSNCSFNEIISFVKWGKYWDSSSIRYSHSVKHFLIIFLNLNLHFPIYWCYFLSSETFLIYFIWRHWIHNFKRVAQFCVHISHSFVKFSSFIFKPEIVEKGILIFQTFPWKWCS